MHVAAERRSALQLGAMETPSILIIGNDSQAGTYILRIRLKENTTLKFGRFKKGKLVSLPAGDYVYIGSALSEKGSTSLARRLIRHATRSGDKPQHAIREAMVKQFHNCGLGPSDPLPKNGKKLFWNVDFLLDLPSVELVNIFAIRSSERLENRLAKQLERDPHTEIIERGLGANDAPGATHLLRIRADKIWWASLMDKVRAVLEDSTLNQTNDAESRIS